MPRDLTVIIEDRPGELARLGEITGEAGVNIHGLAAFTGEGKGVVHVLVDDDDAARCHKALEAATIGVADEREVLVVDIEDRPGALGELARRLADANVNVDLVYTTFGGVKVVIATDDLNNARAAVDY
ncbi:ACT domain-containing protein [Actinoallomurus sp. NPDC050550]|uniref:ACT domain-containing protein n=1 Tax=Actinoallomurus sp. NPDC050550 TaxID=3154937 RepID=UPI0033FFD98D